jgi:hypothetical protein
MNIIGNKKEAKELYLNERLKVKASSFATHILHMAMINKETGEVEYEVNKDVRFKNPKKGYCKMYRKDMQEVIIELSNYPTALKLWAILWDFMKKDGSIKMPLQKDLAEMLNTSISRISSSLKRLRELEVIEKIDNEWRYNPFIFAVVGMSNEDLYEAQRIWEEYIGHYKAYKEVSIKEVEEKVKRKREKLNKKENK